MHRIIFTFIAILIFLPGLLVVIKINITDIHMCIYKYL